MDIQELTATSVYTDDRIQAHYQLIGRDNVVSPVCAP